MIFDKLMEINKTPIKIDDESYCLIIKQNTKENNVWESHNKYIDLVYIISGKETIKTCKITGMKAITKYDEEVDVILYEKPENYNEIKLSAGMFAVFHQDDAHSPWNVYDNPETVTKLIIKIRKK